MSLPKSSNKRCTRESTYSILLILGNNIEYVHSSRIQQEALAQEEPAKGGACITPVQGANTLHESEHLSAPSTPREMIPYKGMCMHDDVEHLTKSGA